MTPHEVVGESYFQRLSNDLGRIQDVSLALEMMASFCAEALDSGSVVAIALDGSGRVQNTSAADFEVPLSELLRSLERSMAGALTGQSINWFLAPYPGDDGEQDGLFLLPLTRGSQTLGLVASRVDPQDLAQGETRTQVEVLGALGSLVLENMRLSGAALHQGSELSVFYESAVAVDQPEDISKVIRSIVQRASEVIESRGGFIDVWEGERLSAHDTAYTGWFVESVGRAPGRHERRTIRERIRQQSEALVFDIWLPEENVAGFALAAPLLWQGRMFGLLGVTRLESDPGFATADRSLIGAVASQAANALAIALLLQSERRQQRMLQALQEAALSVSSALAVEDVLDEILQQVMRAFPCDAANYMSVDQGVSRVTRSLGYGQFGISENVLHSMEMPLDSYPNLARLLDRRPGFITDTRADPSWTTRPGFEWLRAWAGAPVQYGGQLLGFICLDSQQPGRFDASTLKGLVAFAAHAAAALRNAQLYERLLLEHRHLEKVYRIGQRISGTLDEELILAGLLEGSLQTLGAEFAAAYRIDEASVERLQIAAPEEGSPFLFRDPDLIEILREAARSGEVLDLVQHDEKDEYWIVGFPVADIFPASVAAAVWFQSEQGSHQSLMDVLAAVGQQAGLALSNSKRHTQVERRVAELTLLQRVVGAIAQRLEVDSILEEVAHQLHERLDFPAVQIIWRDGDRLYPRKFAGPPPPVESTFVNEGVIGRVFRSGAPALVKDVASDPDYVSVMPTTVAELAVPIQVGDEVVGAINVESSRAADINADALELLELVANQVSIALQNANLYEQVRRNVATLEARVRERTAKIEEVLEEAKSAERAKAQFVADVSHELRTPLTNIGLYLDLLEVGDQAREQEYMSTLRRETERLANLIDQLLNLSRLDTDQIEVQVESIDFNHVVRQLLDDRKLLIESKELRLETNLDPANPRVVADAKLLSQVISNLLSNAMSYTPHGGLISIRSEMEPMAGRNWLKFEVADTGPGVPAHEQPHIFERFFRGQAGRASGVAGTGLGLAICEEIVKRLKGSLALASSGPDGSTFVVRLPAS